jgi:hypothetical protein
MNQGGQDNYDPRRSNSLRLIDPTIHFYIIGMVLFCGLERTPINLVPIKSTPLC